MTKAQIIAELHSNGESWANDSYTKAQLENYLNNLKAAKNMSMEELLAKINSRKAGA